MYFALVSKFLTFMKRFQRFLIIGWVVREELVRENVHKKASMLHIWSFAHQEKIEGVEFLKKGKFQILKGEWGPWQWVAIFMDREVCWYYSVITLVRVKRHYLRPFKIYCSKKTQLVQKPLFHFYFHFNQAMSLTNTSIFRHIYQCYILVFDRKVYF